jgi:hypothetical protein
MNENIKYGFLFLTVGVASLYFGLSWKKPSYGGGIVHKYGSIALGIIFIIASIFSFCNFL